MTKFLTGALLASAALAASPALAADAFTEFNGTNGAGGFFYGSAVGTTLIDFDVSASGGNCFLPNPPAATCLKSSAYSAIPGVSKGGTFPTVDYSGATLALHPLADGNTSADVFASFEAATAGTYSYSIKLQSIGTDTTNGVGYTLFTGDTFGTRSVLNNYLDGVTITGRVYLAAGQRLGTVIDANGFYGGDTTALTFGVTAVPEPAQWALMIGGFGLAGIAARRRRLVAA
jgi:hypothetical protein